jgi:hypothetical protein
MKYKLPPILVLIVFSIGFAPRCLASKIDIKTTKVPNGTAETAYSAVITASGGCTPYKWAVVKGSLPPGITQKSADQTTAFELKGTPTAAASYSFTVSVTGCGGGVAEASYKIVIQGGANQVVDLQWTASTSNDIAGYNVYRGPDTQHWKKLNASLVTVTDYDDSTVSSGSTYYYSATTVSSSGEESGKSPPIEVTVPE